MGSGDDAARFADAQGLPERQRAASGPDLGQEPSRLLRRLDIEKDPARFEVLELKAQFRLCRGAARRDGHHARSVKSSAKGPTGQTIPVRETSDIDESRSSRKPRVRGQFSCRSSEDGARATPACQSEFLDGLIDMLRPGNFPLARFRL